LVCYLGHRCIVNDVTWHACNQNRTRVAYQEQLRRKKHEFHATPEELADSGKRLFLAASVVGSRRHLHAKMLDALAVCRALGKPDLFITYTFNPHRVRADLPPNVKPQDRPELVARIFVEELEALISEITTGAAFGSVAEVVHVIEMQKSGNPHAHIVVWLTEPLVTPEDVDNIICAEIPDPRRDPELHRLVLTHMVHCPCCEYCPPGVKCVCMEGSTRHTDKDHCDRFFPKPFADATTFDTSKPSPDLRRRAPGAGGHTGSYRVWNGSTHTYVEVDNRWIVPYNPELLRRFQSHINVEWCNSRFAIPYLFSYIHKGLDCGLAKLVPISKRTPAGAQAAAGDAAAAEPARGAAGRAARVNEDEVAAFIDGLFIGSVDAFLRLMSASLHHSTAVVACLHFFDPEDAMVVYEEGEEDLAADADITARDDSFLKWFAYNADHPNNLTYEEFGRAHAFHAEEGAWAVRKRPCLVRLATRHPSDGEGYYMRMVLQHARGPKDISDLLHVTDAAGAVHSCSSYRDAAVRLGLLADDRQHHEALQEAARVLTAWGLCRFFAQLMRWCSIQDVRALFNEHLLPQPGARIGLAPAAAAAAPAATRDPAESGEATYLAEDFWHMLEDRKHEGRAPPDARWPDIVRTLTLHRIWNMYDELPGELAAAERMRNREQRTQLWRRPAADVVRDARQSVGLDATDQAQAEAAQRAEADRRAEAMAAAVVYLGPEYAPPHAPAAAPATAAPAPPGAAAAAPAAAVAAAPRPPPRARRLDEHQTKIVLKVLDDARKGVGGIHFVQASAGAGKTQTLNAIIAAAVAEGLEVITAASSGVAALEVEDASTVHTTFNVRVETQDVDRVFDIHRGTHKAQRIAAARMVIWDEQPMQAARIADMMDLTFRDLRPDHANEPFGGIVVVCAGDFRQTLSIQEGANNRAATTARCLHHSRHWPKPDRVHELTTNYRCMNAGVESANATAAAEYAAWLERVGTGTEPRAEADPAAPADGPEAAAAASEFAIRLPARICIQLPDADAAAAAGAPAADPAFGDAEALASAFVHAAADVEARGRRQPEAPRPTDAGAPPPRPADAAEAALIAHVFGEHFSPADGHQARDAWAAGRALLAPKYEDVNRMNELVAHRWHAEVNDGDPHKIVDLLSADSLCDDDTALEDLFPVDVLNEYGRGAVPPHRLTLPHGAMLILLRNLDTKAGLANGTRLRFLKCTGNTLLCRIVSGKRRFVGTTVAIPRIAFIQHMSRRNPTKWKRVQYPVRLAWCMSINKSQAQTLDRVGVLLRSGCFSHGQLYTAASRVGTWDRIRFALPAHRITNNVVFREALLPDRAAVAFAAAHPPPARPAAATAPAADSAPAGAAVADALDAADDDGRLALLNLLAGYVQDVDEDVAADADCLA